MFGNVIGDRFDVADNECEWDSLLVYLWKSIDEPCGLPREKSVVKIAVNNFVLFQVSKVICDFLMIVCRVPLQGFVGGVITQQCRCLPLSAGKMGMFWSLLRDVTAFLCCDVRLEVGVLVLQRAAVTFIHSSSASTSFLRFCYSYCRFNSCNEVHH